jgi:DNA-binding GntR family transcriptional regulator
MDSLRAYNYLESAILTGRLKPRERLIEQELAEQLKMSRTPIREALRRLEERGLVRILPRRGALVSDISSAEVENIYAVRSHLESLAARLAADHITAEGIEQVQRLEAAHAKQASGRDVRALMLANDRFHDAIYVAARNACLFELIRQLRRQVHAIRFTAWARPERIARSLDEHSQMVEALSRRDGERLALLTEAHLRVAKESYLFHLGEQPAPLADPELAGAFAGSAAGNGQDRGRRRHAG